MTTQRSTNVGEHDLARWVAQEILPHEPALRGWLRRFRLSPEDIDEVIQDAYCRLVTLKSVEHIKSPGAYFVSVARNIMIDRLRSQRVIDFRFLAELDSLADEDSPGPEREAGAKLAYARVMNMMAELPERCRKILHWRKIEGWSQKQIAEHLGTTEKAVEKQVWMGIKSIRTAWIKLEEQDEQTLVRSQQTRFKRN